MARALIPTILFLTFTQIPAQTITTLSSSALTYPVPRPVESLEPVAGFRSFESLRARYLSLTLETDVVEVHAVGQSLKGRTIEAYRFAAATSTPEGTPRWGAFLNGSIHPREWASTEAVAGIFEWLALAADDPFRNYLLETGSIVINPLSNPDGFLVTQTYPDRVIGGSGTGSSGRDGRMRRKNLRDTDGVLETLDDYLYGVDLNRNHPYGYLGGGSTSPTAISYRGAGAGSEPETQAIYTAAGLLDESRIRFAVDYHSFSQLFYVITDDSSTRNDAVVTAYGRMQTAIEASSGVVYTSSLTDLATGAIGATDEYFTGQYGAMGYTCEIRPTSGTNGFILPESQVAVMRAEILAGARAGLIYAAGPPALVAVSLGEDGTSRLLQRRLYDPILARRDFEDFTHVIATNQTVQVRFVFNKPMREIDSDGSASLLAGETESVPLAVSCAAGTFSNPQWSVYTRWPGDTLTMSFTPSGGATPGVYTVSLRLVDAANMAIDGDATTVADWSRQGWIGWESTVPDTRFAITIGEPSRVGWELR